MARKLFKKVIPTRVTIVEERKQVMHKVLTPVLIFLRMFGLYYGSIYYETKRSRCTVGIVWRFYCYFINLLLMFGLIMSIVGKLIIFCS